MEEQLRERRFGPITIFKTPEPTLPSILEQARIVARFNEQMYQLNLSGAVPNPQWLDQFSQLAQGDLSSSYVQKTLEEVNREKERLTVEINNEAFRSYDENVMIVSLLPIEQQLELDFHNARAQLWAIENSEYLSWDLWHKIRQLSDHQQDLIPESIKAEKNVSAYENAENLLQAVTRSYADRDRSESITILLKDLFLNGRVAHPFSTSTPIQLPERIPEWVWRDGLQMMVPGWWLISRQETEITPKNKLAIATHPIADVMRKFLTTPGMEMRETRRNPVSGGQIQLISRIEPPAQVVASIFDSDDAKAEETLARITNSLLLRKEEGASLLKIHLDLTDQAYRAGGSQPMLRYNLSEAAERLGYKKPGNRRGYDQGTLRELYKRILTLQSCLIQAYEIRNKKKDMIIGSVPYWHILSFEQLVEGEDLAGYQVLLTDKAAPIYTSLVLQPGLWWYTAQMGKYRQYIPSDILKLDTSGKGNEVNRMALKLAASLSIWERINAEHHGGSALDTSVSEMLEKASIITPDDLIAMGAKAGRTRDYLTEALEVLRKHGEFEIVIRDFDQYDAKGRGWINQFLGAKVGIGIRKLPTSTRSKRRQMKA